MYRKVGPAAQAQAGLDPLLAEGWLNALVEDGLVFTADKVLTAGLPSDVVEWETENIECTNALKCYARSYGADWMRRNVQ